MGLRPREGVSCRYRLSISFSVTASDYGDADTYIPAQLDQLAAREAAKGHDGLDFLDPPADEHFEYEVVSHSAHAPIELLRSRARFELASPLLSKRSVVIRHMGSRPWCCSRRWPRTRNSILWRMHSCLRIRLAETGTYDARDTVMPHAKVGQTRHACVFPVAAEPLLLVHSFNIPIPTPSI